MSGRRRRNGRGALIILSITLASSGALRVGAEVGKAMAGTEGETAAPASPVSCPPPPLALAEALTARENAVAGKEAALADRLAALALTEEAVKARLAELEQAEADLSRTLTIADGAAEEDLVRLTAVYETMKPKDAAALFEAMSPDFAAGFLGRMDPAAAAAVLSGMSADAAYQISVLIAGRNANAPTE